MFLVIGIDKQRAVSVIRDTRENDVKHVSIVTIDNMGLVLTRPQSSLLSPIKTKETRETNGDESGVGL